MSAALSWSCPNGCGAMHGRIGVDVVGFLSGPHAFHHAVELQDDGLLRCCCGSSVEGDVKGFITLEKDEMIQHLESECNDVKKQRDALQRELRALSKLHPSIAERLASLEEDLDLLEPNETTSTAPADYSALAKALESPPAKPEKRSRKRKEK